MMNFLQDSKARDQGIIEMRIDPVIGHQIESKCPIMHAETGKLCPIVSSDEGCGVFMSTASLSAVPLAQE
jgi:hypothetical protein